MTSLQLPVLPQPDPLPQPGPDWLFWSLLALTFVVHLVAMNLLVGGTVIAAVARWRSRTGATDAGLFGAMSSLVAGLMPTAFALTVTFGVAPLLFVQVLYGRLFFTSSVLMGWYWLAVVGLVIAAYAATYRIALGRTAANPPGAVLGLVVAGLLAAVAFVYVNNMSLVWRPGAHLAMFRQSAAGLHLNLADPTWVPRFLHMVLGALAVGGAGVAVAGLAVRGAHEALARVMVRHGARWFTAATAVNLLAGLWWVVALPRETLLGFMRASLVAPLVLALGIITGLGALALMAVAVKADQPWNSVRIGAWHIVATMALMVVTRDHLRHVSLAAAGFSPRAWVEPQWGAILLFVALLAVALASVAWMVAALVRSGRGQGAHA